MSHRSIAPAGLRAGVLGILLAAGWLLAAAHARAEEGDPLGYTRTRPGFDAARARALVGEHFAGRWRVALTEDGDVLSGRAEIAPDGSSIQLILDGPAGEERYSALEVDAALYPEGSGPFTASLAARFVRSDEALRAPGTGGAPVVPLPVPRNARALSLRLGDRTLDLGIRWLDRGRQALRLEVATRAGLDRLGGTWSEEMDGELHGGGPASLIRGEPDVAGVLVVEDPLAGKQRYPYRRDGSPIEHLARTRTLVVYGEHLPRFADGATIRSLSDAIAYAPNFLDGDDRQNTIEAAFERAGVPYAAQHDAFVVDAVLQPGVTSGSKVLSVNGARGTWPLVFANQVARMRFVRREKLASDVFYPGDVARVRISLPADVPLEGDGVGVVIARGARGELEDGVVWARRLEVDPGPATYAAEYLSDPIHLVHRMDDAVRPPDDPDALPVPVLEGAQIHASLADPAQVIAVPPVVKATIFDDPSQLGPLWKEALDRVAACDGREVAPAATGEREAYARFQREQATRVGHVILTDSSRSIAIYKGDHAAAILIRDELVRLLHARLPGIRSHENDLAFARALRERARTSGGAGEPFWRSMEATYVEEGRVWDSETTLPLAETLDELGVAERFGIGEAAARAWAEEQTVRAWSAQIPHIESAIAWATAGGDCDLEALLLVAGHRSPEVVARIVPRLVQRRSDPGPPRRQYWVADAAAQTFVGQLHVTGAAVRAQEAYSQADTNVALAVGALATRGGALLLKAGGYASAAALAALAGETVGVAEAVLNVQRYAEGERAYEFARGAAPVLGGTVLDEAAARRQSAVGTLIGVLAPNIAGAAHLPRLRHFKNVARGRKLFDDADVLDDLTRLSEGERVGLAGYYADLLERTRRSGLEALDDVDRAALGSFQDYFRGRGATPPPIAREADAVIARAMRREALARTPVGSRASEADPRFAETVLETPPSAETVLESPPTAGTSLDDTTTIGAPADPRLEPRGRDIWGIIEDAPVDDSPPLPVPPGALPDLTRTPPGSLSDHLSPRQIQELFEPGRSATPQEIIQKADLIRSGRVPPQYAQGDPKLREALSRAFGLKRARRPGSGAGAAIEPAPPGGDPLGDATFTDRPPGLDPRLDETVVESSPRMDPTLDETLPHPPPGGIGVDDSTLVGSGRVRDGNPGTRAPEGGPPPADTIPPARVESRAAAEEARSLGASLDAALARQRKQALGALADYVPGAQVRLSRLESAESMLRPGSATELERAERIHASLVELGVPEVDALAHASLHYQRSTSGLGQKMTEAHIVAEGILMFGSRPVTVEDVARATGLGRTAARAASEQAVQWLGNARGLLRIE